MILSVIGLERESWALKETKKKTVFEYIFVSKQRTFYFFLKRVTKMTILYLAWVAHDQHLD